jgi:hypothetical protein
LTPLAYLQFAVRPGHSLLEGDEYGAGIRVVAEAGAQQASRFQAEEQSDMLSWRKIVAASFSRLSTLKAAFS